MRTVLAVVSVVSVVSRSLKKVLLSRVELWIVAILLSLAALGFGTFMKDAAERAAPRGGALGRVAFRIGATPQNLYRWFFGDPTPPRPGGSRQRFHGEAGLTFATSLPPPRGGGRIFTPPGMTRQDGEAGYLVVARYVPLPEKDSAEPDSIHGHTPIVVELIDLNRRKTVHSWKPILNDRLLRLRFYVLPDGSLLAGSIGNGDGGMTFRVDACSNVVWEQPLRAHHSYERGADGNIWSPWRIPNRIIPRTSPDRVADGFIKFSPEGEVLSRITLSGALMRAGHHRHLYNNDGTRAHAHVGMNDVEPVLQDGPFWRRGDLFVSLQVLSVVLLYRPATDEVLWLQAGPWLHQHDVDIVSDSEISVYSNNTFVDEDGDERVRGANEIYVHDFATGETRSPWREAMRRHDVRTRRRGGVAVFGDGSVMLEEADQGRVLMLSPDGEEVWSYVNRASDGMVYGILASRWLDAEYGAEVARSIAAFDC